MGRVWRATWVDMQGDAIDWARWAFPAAAAAPRRERASAAEAAALPAEIFVPVIELEGWGAARLRAELDQLMVRAGACSPTAARGALIALTRPAGSSCSDKGVRLAQNMRVGPCIHVGILVQLQKAEVGPASGPTWRPSHLEGRAQSQEGLTLGGSTTTATAAQGDTVILHTVIDCQ